MTPKKLTPSDYKALIIKETKLDSFRLSDEDFQTFADIARTFGSGKLVLDQWIKFLETGNTSIKDFTDWCIDFHLGEEE